jgi:hypothetical protein
MLTGMITNTKHRILAERLRQLGQWLEDEAPYVQFDQRHLDAGTLEQAYWHLGYATALRDALFLLSDGTESTPDTSTRSLSGGQDE